MLRIQRLTDYAIVLLVHLARERSRAFSATELSLETRIPIETVYKVLKGLRRQGILTSQRGASGGYTLGCAPSEMNLADVIECMEGPIAMTECSIEDACSCEVEPHCAVGPHWPAINGAVRSALAAVMLTALMTPAPQEVI